MNRRLIVPLLCLIGVGLKSPAGFTAALGAMQENAEEIPFPELKAPADSILIDGNNFQERSAAFLTYCSGVRPIHPDFPKESMIYYVARVLTGRDVDHAVAGWRDALNRTLNNAEAFAKGTPGKKRMEPFDKHVLVWAWILCRDKVKLPTEIEEKTKAFVSLWHHREWKGYGALNYRLMMDGTGFLAAEQWPDLKDADGLDAHQVKSATKKRLMAYFREIPTKNTHEYGSPTYLGVDLGVMKMLADHAGDQEVRRAASMALDAMFLQVASAWNQGYLVTPAGRSKYWGSSTTSPDAMDATAACAWFFWGAARPVSAPHLCPHHSAWFALPGYSPPKMFGGIAHDRNSPATIRSSALFGQNQVRITIHHARSYSLSSQWEWFPSPRDALCKETRREMFKWISDKPASTFVPLQENLQKPYDASNAGANAFGYGENPYTQELQEGGTLIAVSNVEESYPYWKIYVPFTTQGAILKRIEKNRWMFCHGGSVLFAFKTVKPFNWGPPSNNCDILWSDSRKNGWILETSEIAPFAGGGVDAELDRFANAVVSKTLIDDSGVDTPIPRLKFKNLAGHQLDITFRPVGAPYLDQHRIDGAVVNYPSFPLIESPWCSQQVGADILDLSFGKESLRYDFKNWTVQDRGADSSR